MSFRSSALIWSRSIACATLLAVMAGCASPPPSTPPVASSPTSSPEPLASPTATPQSIPQPPTPPKLESSPEVKPASNPNRTVESCVVRMAKVNDPESPLNIRSSPNTSSKENIIGQLPNGAFVDVEDEQNGWFKITGEKPGWIAKSKTESNCSQKVERVQFGTGQNTVQIVDRFIGVGSHKYIFNLAQGQKLTVSRDRSVFPMIVAPDGKTLTDYREDQKSWTGEIPTTGDYAIIFESNYKGYEYGVSVDVQ